MNPNYEFWPGYFRRRVNFTRYLVSSMVFSACCLYTEPLLAKNTLKDIKNTQQQTRELTGIVYDDQQNPLFGVTVQEEGTNNTVITDKNGSYKISIPSGINTKLKFSFLGKTSKIVTVGERRKLDVTLELNSNEINEVVVTGFGNIEKENYTGSANIINGKDLSNRPVGSFENALAGLSPGLVVASSGQPGDVAEVRLRGFGSMSSSSQPLYVIDGMVFDQDNTTGHSGAVSSPMATLNPNDIASITILKDAASASLYGSQGANGVIVITTKQGNSGDRVRYNINAQTGISKIFNQVKPDLINSEEYMKLWTEGQLHDLVDEQVTKNRGNFKETLDNLYKNKTGFLLDGKNYYQWEKLARQDFNSRYRIPNPAGGYYDYDFWGADLDKLPNTNWYNEIMRTARFQQYDFSMNGGSSTLKYYLSLGYLDQEGVIINSDLKRYSLRLNLSSDDKSRLINWGLNSTISSTEQSGPLTSGTNYNIPHYAALLLPAVVPAYLSDGSYNFRFPNNLLNGSHNPIASANDNIRERPQFSLMNAGWVRINFKPWLNFKSDLTQYYITGRRIDYFDQDFGSGYGSNGDLTMYNSRRIKLTNRNTLNYNQTILKNHRITALAALEIVDFKQEWTSISAVNFLNDDKPVLSSAAEVSSWSGSGYDYSLLSLISKLDYSYKNRYYLGGSFRQDQSSRFSPEHRAGNFWSVSGSYRLSNEDWKWVKNISPIVNNIQLKASYGYNGNLPTSYYSWQNLYNGAGRYNNEHAISQTYRSNYELSWEKNKIYNFGLDLSFLKNKIKISAEYYQRKSSDLLQDVPVSKTTGYNTMLMNTSAGILNKGFEFDAQAKLLEKSIKWDLKFNLATLNSKYYGLKQDIIGSHIMRNGESVNSWFTHEFAGINSFTGQILYYAIDPNGNKIIANSDNPSERRVLGKAVPTATGGMTNTFSYLGFEISSLITFGWGHIINDARLASRTGIDGQSMDYNVERSQLDSWTPDNIFASNRIRINGQPSAGGSTRYMYKGDYIKFKNIRLGYNFPPSTFKRIKLNNVSVFTQIENLAVLTEHKGYDPDLQLNGEISAAKFPTATTMTFGLNLNF